MSTAMLEAFAGQVSEEQTKAASESNLIPGGRYRATLVDPGKPEVNNREFFDKEETKKNPHFNKLTTNMRFSLTAARANGAKDGAFESLEKALGYFIRVCLEPAYDDRTGKLTSDSEVWGKMCAIYKQATGQSGPQDRVDVITYFMENAVEINISRTEATEKDGRVYDAKNWFRGFSIIKGE